MVIDRFEEKDMEIKIFLSTRGGGMDTQGRRAKQANGLGKAPETMCRAYNERGKYHHEFSSLFQIRWLK